MPAAILHRHDIACLTAEVEDMSSTQKLVVQELTQCKEEGKAKDVCIAELTVALQQASEEHRRKGAEIMLVKER